MLGKRGKVEQGYISFALGSEEDLRYTVKGAKRIGGGRSGVKRE